jgi:hypothetical protein
MHATHGVNALASSAAILTMLIGAGAARAQAVAAANRPFGLEQVIAVYGAPKEIAAANFVLDMDGKYWRGRRGVASRGVTHQQFLQKSVDEGATVLANLETPKDSAPVVTIDEFGWDYDGGIDRHSAAILKAVHRKKPGLKIAVWQMRGPVAPQLAAVYRDTVELVLLETYVDLKDSWMIAFQLQAARLSGLLGKTVIGLGIGKESPDLGGWAWTQTADELDQQLRLIRFVGPESPGVALFGLDNLGKCPLTKQQLEQACGRFSKLPTDGTGLRPELLKLANTFTARYEKPAIFCSSEFFMPYFHCGHDGGPWGSAYSPPVARVLMMNLGEKDAKRVKVALRTPKQERPWAASSVDIPARSVAVALLPILPGKKWNGWAGSELLDVDAPGCEVQKFTDSRFAPK